MSKFTKGLNAEQSKAVRTTKGPLLILAGAGTGKTRVITHRIAHMLSRGVAPRSVLAMTFTNKAAAEMKDRIRQLVSKSGVNALTVGTFHSFCMRSLRQYGDRVGIRKAFGICDADDQLVAMKRALRELQIPETTLAPRACLGQVSLLKNRMVAPDALASSGDDRDIDVAQAYRRYDASLRASGVLDFDDLLLYMVKLLDDKRTLSQFRKRFQYLLVDEYQDTNGPQYEIVKRIGGEHRNVCVVGDDDQSIYGWRGADVSKILNFEHDFPKAVVVRLETNYRSTPEIIDGANAVIRNNTSRHKKALRAAGASGESIQINSLPDEEAEAQYVVEDVLARVRERLVPPGDVAILFRTALQPRLFELRLREHNIPYVLVGGMSFFDRKEIKDMLSYLKLVANPEDELSLLRVINTPSRGIGLTSVEKMLAVAAERSISVAEVIRQGDSVPGLRAATVESARQFLSMIDGLRELQDGPNLVDLIKRLIREVRYDRELERAYADPTVRAKRWEAVKEVVNMAELHARRRRGANLGSFLDDVALSASDEEEGDEPSDDKLTLMTLHSAKGLEFGEVYLVGVEEGLLPHLKSIQDGDVDEERRLAYVGITRAKRRLTITYAKSRAKFGQRVTPLPSRFLYELHGKQPPAAWLERAHGEAAQGSALDKSVDTADTKPASRAAGKKKSTRSTSRKQPARKRPPRW